MATFPPEPILPRDAAVPTAGATPVALERAWLDMHGQAAALAQLAQISAEPDQFSPSLNGLIADTQPWQQTLLAQGIDDVAAMLGSGMAALATLSGRGQDTAAPALALWREFHAARGALLAVLETQAAA